jgi:branched-chain amino acid transport system ATP-binding protein
MTILENLQMGAYIRQGSQSAQSIDRDLEVVLATFPRLRERLSQLAGTLSGGEQQMVAIARAMMAKPKLLLLDEPSMGLAPLMVETIFEVIQKLNQEGMTILLVEQNARLALSMADRAYVMESGAITLSGSADQLFNDDRVREAYLGVDLKT